MRTALILLYETLIAGFLIALSAAAPVLAGFPVVPDLATVWIPVLPYDIIVTAAIILIQITCFA